MLRVLVLLVVVLGLMLMQLWRLGLVVQLMGMLAKMLHRLSQGAEGTVRLQPVVRGHGCVQATSFEVRFHRQHVFRRSKQLAGFH